MLSYNQGHVLAITTNVCINRRGQTKRRRKKNIYIYNLYIDLLLYSDVLKKYIYI